MTTTTNWTFSAAEVQDAIRAKFGLPADAVITVNTFGSASATLTEPAELDYTEIFRNCKIKNYFYEKINKDYLYEKVSAPYKKFNEEDYKNYNNHYYK